MFHRLHKAEDYNCNNANKIGYIANHTDIFDYVILQPGYLWNPYKIRNIYGSIEDNRQYYGVNYCANNNRVYDYLGVGNAKSSNCYIGPEMEIGAGGYIDTNDDFVPLNYDDDAGVRNRYAEYNTVFKGYRNTCPIAFYVGDRNELFKSGGLVYGKVKEFYYDPNAPTNTPIATQGDSYESNNSFETAKTISTNSNTIATIHTSSDVDYYKFTVDSSKNVTVSLTCPSGLDYDANFYDANQAQISALDLTGSSSPESKSTTLSSGTYYAKVYGYNGTNSTSSYTLVVTVPTNTPTPTIYYGGGGGGGSKVTKTPTPTLTNTSTPTPTNTSTPTNTPTPTPPDKSKYFTSDINGDGKKDTVCVAYYEPNAQFNYSHIAFLTAISNGDGSYNLKVNETGWGWNDRQKWLVGDINKDGKLDIIGIHPTDPNQTFNLEHITILSALSNGDGTYERFQNEYGWGFNDKQKWFIGDLDGDGDSDIAFVNPSGANTAYPFLHIKYHTFISNGNGTKSVGFQTNEQETGWGWNDRQKWLVGDINKDGKSDILFIHPTDPNSFSIYEHISICSALSNGNGTYSRFQNESGWGFEDRQQWLLGDIDGDGDSDIDFVHPFGANVSYPYIHAKFHNFISNCNGVQSVNFSTSEQETGWKWN